MITIELKAYVQEQLNAGVSPEVLRQTLLASGWGAQDIDEVLSAAGQGMPVQNTTPAVPTYASTQEVPVTVQSSYRGWIIAAVIVVLIVLGAGGAYAAYHFGVFSSSTPALAPTTATATSTLPIEAATTTTESNSATTTAVEATSSPCADYQCLIAAALKCQPISVTVSYTNQPNPIIPGGLDSGQAKYAIAGAGAPLCKLTFSNPVNVVTLSSTGEKAALRSGLTEAQITQRLQMANESFELAADMQSTCFGTANVIAAFLTGTEKGTVNVESNGKSSTYTTPSGKLSCAIMETSTKTTLSLYVDTPVESNDIIFYVDSIMTTVNGNTPEDKAEITITDHKTGGASQTVTFVPNETKTVAGHTITVTSIQNGITTLTYQ